MVIQAIETDSIDRVQDTVGRLIDLFNSYESREFLENKIQQARDGLVRLENAMEVSLYEGMQAMRQLVTDIRIHLWSRNSAISRFQFNSQSLHYLLTRASDVVNDNSLSDREKVKEIWDGITESLSQDEDRNKAEERLKFYLHEWRQACRLPECNKQKLENQIKMDSERGLEQHRSDIEDLFTKLRKYFDGLKIKLEKTQHTIVQAEQEGVAAGTAFGARLSQSFERIVTTPGVRAIEAGEGTTVDTAVGGLVSLCDRTLGPSVTEMVVPLVGAAIPHVAPSAGKLLAQILITDRGGGRFLSRKETDWYPYIENALFDYIRGNMTDYELRKLIRDEQLEEDLHHIREHLQCWIANCRDLVDKIEIPKLNKEAFVLEAKRMWSFAKALLLDDREYVEQHSELLSKLINTALSSGDDVSPFISVARLPDRSQTLKMKLIVQQTADKRAVHNLVCNIGELAGGFKRGCTRDIAADGTYEYEISFNETDGIKRFLGALAKEIGQLADAHVRAALLGDYDVNVGSRLTNPAFNRIYGRGLRAPGFLPTVFSFLDYSGEKYYCPTGWRRISINVADSAAEFDRRYGGWHVAYHGTNHVLAATILTTGFVPTSGGAYSRKKEVVYFSPSIEYAGHPGYAKLYEVSDRSGAKKYMQMVLQVRINPANISKKVGGTLPGAFDPSNGNYNMVRDNPPADPHFPNNENLEWLVEPIPGTSGIDMFRKMFVIYGIMIRVSDTDPRNHPANHWWQKKM